MGERFAQAKHLKTTLVRPVVGSIVTMLRLRRVSSRTRCETDGRCSAETQAQGQPEFQSTTPSR
jgi:hypothetical protein